MAGAVTAAMAQPLTLEAVLALADQPHPQLAAMEAQVRLAAAERLAAESARDLRLTLEAALRGGRNSLHHAYGPDHVARLNLRKPLWDGTRYEAGVQAARLEEAARGLQLADARSQRRIRLMGRYFDVLLADQQYAADTEAMAVAYVRWDDARQRAELGELAAAQLAELESAYHELRVRQRASADRMREARARLAAEMGRPDELPAELAEPRLTGNDRPLPAFERLLALMQAENPLLRMQRQRLAAGTRRIEAARAEQLPMLELEAEAAAYTRASSTRDNLRAGLNLSWPIHAGRLYDARLAREQAQLHALQAEHEQLWLALRQELLQTWHEIQHLREVERKAAEVEMQARELALERARAEYELELRTNLGTSMAQTQYARLRQKAAEYRLALAWERLAALVGRPLDSLEGSP
ncbi:MAG: TolC family protein [Thiobacillaceae bacterium]|nr:TolC family protein [Thiobacillaceae bacterium]MDW8323859.1 TolC family protein [Burkholderiales bacterium]